MVAAKTILILLARIIPFVALLGAIYMIVSLILTTKYWKTNKDD